MTYQYDGLLRVIQATKASSPGSGSYPSQVSIYTTYTYDGAGNVLSTSTQPYGGSPTLTTLAAYAPSRLPTSKRDEKFLTTAFAYSNGGSTVTTSLPNGSSVITSKHLDETPNSVTGNGEVNQFTSAVVNGDGTITSKTYLGSSGSPRYTTTQTDWLGRTTAQTNPGYGGSTFTKQSYYNTAGQLYKTTQTGMAATLYEYDSLGQLLYYGLANEGNSTLDLAGSGSVPDRVTETRNQIYVDSSNIWWNQTLNYVFNQVGNANPVLKAEVRQKLVPYPNSLGNYQGGVAVTETDTYDYYRNLTTDVTTYVPSSQLVTETKTLPDSSVPAVNEIYNGLPESSTNRSESSYNLSIRFSSAPNGGYGSAKRTEHHYLLRIDYEY